MTSSYAANKARCFSLRVATLCAPLLAAVAIAGDVSPYRGEEARDIKALSEQEIDAYLSGQGMGYAKAAELNGYPGPKHVLELSEELALSPAQKEQTLAIHAAMQSRAITLGEQLVARERDLDQEFASGAIDGDTLEELLKEIALLEGQIRGTHLAAHIEQRKLLSPRQVTHYMKLRGYGSSQGHDTHRGH